MDLPTLWFALAVGCWVLFFVLEGFDFGVGMLAPLLGRGDHAQRDHERGAVIGTVGPVWDGNEVWLVAAIGATFAAFPDWYAALLSGLYLPLVAVLLALAARGVALEFRGKVDTALWRRRCETVLAVSSLLVAALWGAVLGVLTSGLALDPAGSVAGSGAARSVAPLLTPAAGAGAVLGVLAALVQGATFLGLRTTGPVRVRARAVAVAAATATALVAAAVVLAVPGALVAPAALSAGVVALLVAAAALLRREAVAFGAASLGVAAAVVAVFTAHLPVVLPSTLDAAASLTITGAAASPTALGVITWGAVLILPGVVAYQAFSYWVFRRRVASERVASERLGTAGPTPGGVAS